MRDDELDPPRDGTTEPSYWPDIEASTGVQRTLRHYAGLFFGIVFLVVAIGAAIAALVFGVILAIKVLPSHVVEKANPGYIDNIFGNRWVVWAARLVVLGLAVVAAFGSLYVCASIVMRMVRGHWLRAAGPFQAEVVEKVGEDIEDAGEIWLNAWQESEAKNTELSQHLDRRTRRSSGSSSASTSSASTGPPIRTAAPRLEPRRRGDDDPGVGMPPTGTLSTMEVAETMPARERDIERQIAENRELLAAAAAERRVRTAEAAKARATLRRAQQMIRRAAGLTA